MAWRQKLEQLTCSTVRKGDMLGILPLRRVPRSRRTDGAGDHMGKRCRPLPDLRRGAARLSGRRSIRGPPAGLLFGLPSDMSTRIHAEADILGTFPRHAAQVRLHHGPRWFACTCTFRQSYINIVKASSALGLLHIRILHQRCVC